MTESARETLLDILKVDLDLDIRRLRPDATLIGDLGFDSVAFAIGLVAIEERLGVALSERELLGCRTFEDVVMLVDQAVGYRSTAYEVTSAQRAGTEAEALDGGRQ